MSWGIRGVIEGFYGRPWTWDERIELGRWCADRGMTHYVYAPKDDPLHRERWREPYPDETLAAFARFADEGGVGLAFAVSPGLTIDYGSDRDRATLLAKLRQVVDLGADIVCLALDDIPVRAGLGEEHARLTVEVAEALPDTELVLVPTEYTGTSRRTPYLDALGRGLPPEIHVAWTGPTVVTDRLTVADAEARTDALRGHPPFVWDNYPVNDTVMADRLFLGPLRGREAGLAEVCSGWTANPMVQPRSSKLPLASVAAFLRGEDPEAVWNETASALGHRVFAEACDGARPRELVGALVGASAGERAAALDELGSWLEEAAACEAPGLEDEVGPWIEQVHAEAGAGLTAVRILQRLGHGGAAPGDDDVARAFQEAMLLAMQWQTVGRGDRTVMGVRRGVRPVFSQDEQGRWVFRADTVEEGHNAIDALARFTFAAVERRAEPR